MQTETASGQTMILGIQSFFGLKSTRFSNFLNSNNVPKIEKTKKGALLVQTLFAIFPESAFWNPTISDNGERKAFWSYYWDPEYVKPEKSGISLVYYLSDVEDEKDAESTFTVAIIVGGILPFTIGAMVIFYLKKKPMKL